MKLVYQRFLEGKDLVPEDNIDEFWRNSPPGFSPSEISSELLVAGSHLTFYGVYHVDPLSPIFELFDKIILSIRGKFPPAEPPLRVFSAVLANELRVKPDEMVPIFHLITRFAEFNTTLNPVGPCILTLTFDRSEVVRKIHQYWGLQQFMEQRLEKQRAGTDPVGAAAKKIRSSTTTGATVTPINVADSIPLKIGPALIERKAGENMLPVMGVAVLAAEMTNPERVISEFVLKYEHKYVRMELWRFFDGVRVYNGPLLDKIMRFDTQNLWLRLCCTMEAAYVLTRHYWIDFDGKRVFPIGILDRNIEKRQGGAGLN
jgi:hypothetical protein